MAEEYKIVKGGVIIEKKRKEVVGDKATKDKIKD